MQFFKAVLSTILIAAPMCAMAAPAEANSIDARGPSDVDTLISQLLNLVDVDTEVGLETRDLEARAGWTCSWLAGNKGCQIKVIRFIPGLIATDSDLFVFL